MSVNEVNTSVTDDAAQGRSEGRAATDHEEVAEQSSEASSSEARRPKAFRCRGSKFLITFSQCPVPKEEVAARLPALYPDLNGYIVAEESHANGDPHLHVYLDLKGKRDIQDPFFFDPMVGPPYHGSIEAARSPAGSIRYCQKEGCYVSYGVDVRTKSRKRKERTVSEAYFQALIGENQSKDDLDFRYGPYRLLHGQSLDREIAHQLRLRAKRFRVTSIQKPVKAEPGDTNPLNADVAHWLNANIRTELPRDLRQAQLWIVTKPGAGKTTFKDIVLPWLYPGLSVYQLPYDGEWYDAYEDGCYDLIIADEFRGHCMKAQHMNQLADGSVISLRRRGTPPAIKRDRLPLIVLSNYTPEEAYNKLADKGDEGLKALKERFMVLRYGKGERLRVQKDGSRPPVALNHPHAPVACMKSTYAPGPPKDIGPVAYDIWNGVEDPERYHRSLQQHDSPLTLSPYSP